MCYGRESKVEGGSVCPESIPRGTFKRGGRLSLNVSLSYIYFGLSPSSSGIFFKKHNTTRLFLFALEMSDDDEYEIPLVDQRVFGAGIKRKRVKFVPSTTASSNPTPPGSSAKSVSDHYLSLVLPPQEPDQAQSSKYGGSGVEQGASQVCEICKLPLEEASTEETELSKSRPHEASLAHQVCLVHSHPPSHLDRSRKGLAYLSAYGWDPDARVGLGASGQGIQFPIKSKPKDDKLGIGVVVPKEFEKRKKKEVKLDAGKVRKMQEADRKKGEKLREMFYRNDDVERYLGGG